MTTPINNANFTSPISRDTHQTGTRARTDTETAADVAPKTPRDDSVQLSQPTGELAPDSGLKTAEDARQTLERTKQLFAADPDAAISAFGNLDAAAAAGFLHQAA